MEPHALILHRRTSSPYDPLRCLWGCDVGGDSEMAVVLAVAAGVIGLAVGSFLNVVAHRVPLGLSLSHPPSRCPGCEQAIRPRDNIPVLSWLLLRGRCRACGIPIPVKYPFVELANAGLWVGLALVLGPTWVLPSYLWFASVGLVLIVTDLEHHRLPNRIVLHGTWVGALLLALGGVLDGAEVVRFLRATAGGGAWFLLMLVIALAARGGFGFGDVKAAVLLGLFVAYQPLLAEPAWFDVLGSVAVAVFLSFFIGGGVAIGLMLLRRADRKREIAFGPAMVVASLAAAVWGDQLLSAWLG